jgi:hypothetical protein
LEVAFAGKRQVPRRQVRNETLNEEQATPRAAIDITQTRFHITEDHTACGVRLHAFWLTRVEA